MTRNNELDLSLKLFLHVLSILAIFNIHTILKRATKRYIYQSVTSVAVVGYIIHD